MWGCRVRGVLRHPIFRNSNIFYTTDSISTAHCKQILPNGLYVVGTPIGNLEDITLRGLSILRSSDIILCEDTRTTSTLLKRYHIDTDRIKLTSYHDPTGGLPNSFHAIIRDIKYSVVSLVSDAGTPCISDPGHVLVKECHNNGLKVFGVPGPSAVVLALSISGLPSDRFIFEGFLPAEKEERISKLQELNEQSRTIVFYEAPARILESLKDCIEVFGGDRVAAVMRELTKLYETVHRGTLTEILPNVKEKGEFVVIISGESGVSKKRPKKKY